MRPKTDYVEKQSPFWGVPELKAAIAMIKKQMPNYTAYQIINIAVFFFLKALKGGDLKIPKIGPMDDVEEKLKIKMEA